MSTVSTQTIKELRLKTGCGILECKDALKESAGDLEAAHRLLRQKGLAKLAKKQARVTQEGVVAVYVDPSCNKAALVEVNTETDFASKSEVFLDFCNDLCADIATNSTQSYDPSNIAPNSSGSDYKSVIGGLVAKMGENLKVSRFAALKSDANTDYIVCYSHLRGKIGVLVKFCDLSLEKRDGFAELAKSVAMHVAAASPDYLKRTDVPSDVVDGELKIIAQQLKKENKPEDKIPMISKGKLNKFFEQVCLVDQKFVKDPKVTVSKVLQEYDANLKVASFYRFQLGETSS